MAFSFSLSSSSHQQISLPLQTSSNPSSSPPRKQYPQRRLRFRRLITASISEMPSPPAQAAGHAELPIRPIPGSYGIPFFSAIKDRLEYFYGVGGREGYFKSRVVKYRSTVFRANMPPGPFVADNSKVIVLLDARSFPTLFDTTKVEKRDLFTGTFMPSTELTGGYRVLSYLDPSEPKHSPLKNLIFSLLKSSRDRVIPSFHRAYTDLFGNLETQLAENGKADFNGANDQGAFNFLSLAYFNTNPGDTELGADGPSIISKWVLFNLSPLLSLGLPKFVEDPLLHTFRLPPLLIKKDYKRLYDFFYESSGEILREADELGISKDEACHNILFATCFNTFGGMKILFPNTLKWVGRAGVKVQTQLAEEIRSAVKSNGGKLTVPVTENMPLLKSVVYESLRLEPPVASQYGKAKRDLRIQSHDAVFEVKKGEMLFGFQPFATTDGRVFDRPEEFVPDRFVGAGEELLKYVLWSNGPETENPTVNNKQCAGKDFVVLVTRLFLVELFLRYDSFEIEVGSSPLGAKVTLTSLKRAGF